MKNMAFILAVTILSAVCWFSITKAFPGKNTTLSTKTPELAPTNREFEVLVELKNLSRKKLEIVGVNQC